MEALQIHFIDVGNGSTTVLGYKEPKKPAGLIVVIMCMAILYIGCYRYVATSYVYHNIIGM